METAKITSKGQVTIPKKVRTKMAVDAGDRLAFRFDDDGELHVVPVRHAVKPLRGFLAEHAAGQHVGEDRIRAALHRRAAEKHRRK